MTRLLLLLLACLLLSPTVAATAAGSAAVQTRGASTLQLGALEYVLGMPAADFDAAASDAWPWQPLARPTLGKQPDGAWLRLSLRNGGTDARLWYLLLKWPVLDRVAVRLHYPDSGRWGAPMLAATPWR